MSQAAQSQANDFSSSLPSSRVSSKVDLFTSEYRRLDKLYSKLSHHLIGLRHRKIVLLEKIDQAISVKGKFIAQIQGLEKIQTKKMEAKRKQKERILLRELQDREEAHQRLSESIQIFKKHHKNVRMDAQYNKAVRLSQLIRSNIQLQDTLNDLISKQEAKRENQQRILKNISILMLQKSQLEGQIYQLQAKFNNKKSSYDLTPQQIQAASATLNEKEQILVKQILSNHQFKDLSTTELIQLKAQEDLERQLLFEQIQKLKGQMGTMKQQNQLMQQALANLKT